MFSILDQWDPPPLLTLFWQNHSFDLASFILFSLANSRPSLSGSGPMFTGVHQGHTPGASWRIVASNLAGLFSMKDRTPSSLSLYLISLLHIRSKTLTCYQTTCTESCYPTNAALHHSAVLAISCLALT